MDLSSIKRGGNAKNVNMTEAYYSAFQHSPRDQGYLTCVNVQSAWFHCSLIFFEHKVIIYRK
jgi:hypothetical protein